MESVQVCIDNAVGENTQEQRGNPNNTHENTNQSQSQIAGRGQPAHMLYNQRSTSSTKLNAPLHQATRTQVSQ